MSILDAANPYAWVWKLLPWAIILLLGLALWGAYGYVQAARQAQAQAIQERDAAVALKAAAETKAREDNALLAAREAELSIANQTITTQRKRIREYKHDGCLSLDTRYDFLDGLLLPHGAAVQPAGGGQGDGAGAPAGEPVRTGVERWDAP